MPTADPSVPPDDRANRIQEGERFGNLIRLKREYRERYVVLHAHPFPELIEQMRACGQRNYSIFLEGDLLFSFFEYVGADFEADMERLAEHSVTQDWWTLTDPMQEPLSEREPDAWWAAMDELYHGGRKTVPSAETSRRATLQWVREEAADAVRTAYRELASELDEVLETASIQNYTVYLLGGRLCTYLECTGDDAARALRHFREDAVVRALRDRVEAQLVDRPPGEKRTDNRREMEAVFYMA